MPERNPAEDFMDAGTLAWRTGPVTDARVQPPPMPRLRWKTIFGWFFLYPLFALPCFYIGSLLLAYWGVPTIEAMIVVGVLLIGPPLGRIKRGMRQIGRRRR